MNNATRDDLYDIEYHIADIRKELIKWCIMPDYMTRDGRNDFQFIVRAVLDIAESCLQFDISKEYIYHYFDFKMNPKILQMEADSLAIQYGEDYIDISDYHQGIQDAYMAAIDCAAELGSLRDLQERLERFVSAVKLHKSK